MNRRFTVALALGTGLAAAAVGRLSAQDFRFRSTTTGRYVELRPVVFHSDSTMRDWVSAPLESTVPITEDLEISAWGLGVQGLRGYALLRGRAAAGGDSLIWPRYDDHFDALYAYLELERPTWRLRGGRQQRFSGLGFYAFDGLTATVRPLSTIRLEAYGGRGLTRGLLEPANAAFRAADAIRFTQGTILLGASAWAAPWQDAAITAVYQRELLSDRSGIASERAAFDAQLGLGEKLYVTASADVDFAASDFGKARASAMYRLPNRGFVEVEVFRYRPVFDLTTIWGVFSPEAHNGAGASVSLSPTAALSVSAGAQYRHYSPSAKSDPFLIGGSDTTGIGDNTTELNTGARWRNGSVQLDGTYTFTFGYGGRQSGGDVALAYAPQGRWRVGVNGTAFQQVQDFRVAGGTVYGAGFEARGPLWDRASLRLEFNRYWHRRETGVAAIDWNQTRALLALDWTFGANADRTRGSY